MTYKFGISWVKLFSNELLLVALIRAFIDSPLALFTDQRHLSLENTFVVAVGVCHTDALSQDVLLHYAFDL